MQGSFARRARAAAAATVTIVAAACSGGGASSGSAAPPATSDDLVVTTVDLGDDQGAPFSLGPSTSATLVPLLIQDDDGRPSVRTIDVTTTAISDAGRPTAEPVEDAAVSMSSAWIVVSTWICTGPTFEDEDGVACGMDARPAILAREVGPDGEWSEVPTETLTTPPQIVAVEGGRARLRLPPADGGAIQREIQVDLRSGVAEELASFDAGLPRCSLAEDDALTFPTSNAPTEALISTPDATERTAVSLPDALPPLKAVLPPNLACSSSQAFLIGGGFGGDGTEAMLVDLREPDAAPVVLGPADWPSVSSAGDAWAVSIDDRILVRTGGDQEVLTVEAFASDSMLVEEGLVIVAYDGDGGLARMQTAPFT